VLARGLVVAEAVVSRHGSSGSVTTSGEEQLAEFDSQFLRV